jgi:hypothetical protein
MMPRVRFRFHGWICHRGTEALRNCGLAETQRRPRDLPQRHRATETRSKEGVSRSHCLIASLSHCFVLSHSLAALKLPLVRFKNSSGLKTGDLSYSFVRVNEKPQARKAGLSYRVHRFPLWRGMCYNRPAVERAAKTPSEPARLGGEPARSHRQDFPPEQQVAPSQGELVRTGELSGRAQAQAGVAGAHEDASRYCPVCSQRLESRRCKLVCPVCGYYMSCADYY